MALTAAQIAARDGKITATFARDLMAGIPDPILNGWYLFVGDPRYVPPPDLTWVWAPRLGSHTESLNCDWYEHKTGHPITRRGEVVIHPSIPWAACTLDGWDDDLPAVFEAKHVGGREPLSKIIERYQPQLHWQMIVTSAQQAVLSVIEGANEPVCETIQYDDAYGDELWRRAEAFMRCVEDLRPPFSVPAVAPPIVAELIVDMTGNNSWADYAISWRKNLPAKKLAIIAEGALKALVPDDAAKCHGHQVVITRNRAGSLSLREAS